MGMKCSPGSNTGFTLLEVLATLVIVGIMTAVAISHLATTGTYGLHSEAEILKAHLRYAQFRAMSDDVVWKVDFTPNSYTLFRTVNGGSWVTSNLPDDSGTPTHIFHDGVVKSGDNQIVTFDQWGSPGGSSITVTLTAGDEVADMVITKNTGFVP